MRKKRFLVWVKCCMINWDGMKTIFDTSKNRDAYEKNKIKNRNIGGGFLQSDIFVFRGW